MTFRFVTWQFVRLMVHLEATASGSPGRQALLEAWQEEWTELDGELTELAQNDFDAYADLMMHHEVVQEAGPEDAAATAAAVLGEVITQLRAEAAESDDDEARRDLQFEAASLTELIGDLEDGNDERGERHPLGFD